MSRRNILSLSAAVALGLAIGSNMAFGQQKTLKEQILGPWTPVSFESFDETGTTGACLFK